MAANDPGAMRRALLVAYAQRKKKRGRGGGSIEDADPTVFPGPPRGDMPVSPGGKYSHPLWGQPDPRKKKKGKAVPFSPRPINGDNTPGNPWRFNFGNGSGHYA